MDKLNFSKKRFAIMCVEDQLKDLEQQLEKAKSFEIDDNVLTKMITDLTPFTERMIKRCKETIKYLKSLPD